MIVIVFAAKVVIFIDPFGMGHEANIASKIVLIEVAGTLVEVAGTASKK